MCQEIAEEAEKGWAVYPTLLDSMIHVKLKSSTWSVSRPCQENRKCRLEETIVAPMPLLTPSSEETFSGLLMLLGSVVVATWQINQLHYWASTVRKGFKRP